MNIKLKCPNCGQELAKIDNSYKCPKGHSFDIAKSGYLNLFISNKTNHGDNKQMMLARTQFLNQDYYLFLKEKICSLISQYHVSDLADFACGEGYYTSSFPVENKVGIDLSKDALVYAAKKDKSTQYILSSIFDVPLFDESLDCITTIFAPNAMKEVERLLRKNGIYIVVAPAAKHLIQMKEFLYEEVYLNEIKPIDTTLKLIHEEEIVQTMHLKDSQSIISLFSMTPYAVKTSKKDCERLSSLNSLDCDARFLIRIYQK